jgi:ABC-2 type transport system permease protein
MSASDLAVRRPGALGSGARLLGSELRLVFTRRRNVAMLAVLALATVLIGVAIEVAGPEPGAEGPPFLSRVTENGVFLCFTALVASLPVFLPLAVSVVSGESVAGEAATGTLRYLLVTPVDRTRLLAVKLASIALFGLVAALVVTGTGMVVGALLFPVGDVTLLSGSTVSFAQGLMRALLVALYVAAMLGTVAALGLFVSTLTEVPVAAMSATAITVVVVEILDAVPQLSPIHPWLFTHDWLAFGGLLRDPVHLEPVWHGLAVQAGWVAVLLSLAWARMTSKDVTC